MSQINLLPWREELREEKKKEFFTSLVGVVIIALGLLFLAGRSIGTDIEYQVSRNSYLTKEIKKLDQQNSEINQLQQKREELIERMNVIQSLQGNRPVIVRLFDELVRTLPDGVHYTNVTYKAGALSIIGVAKSNNRVSELMRKLDRSMWFSGPNLSSVKANPSYGEQASNFVLTVNLSTRDKK
ncbi:MAG: PilN domain-containing protein [Pseudomonadales bacterium]|jgi:type IV pilus assembly protein PilN|nr:PilN domain-containing protein [Pseudomonadales bacterium]